MMNDLISKATVRDLINTWGRVENESIRMQLLHSDLNAIPSVDAVPVVRCKDCAFWLCDEGYSPNGECRCGYLGGWWLPEEYCSGGKRREQTPQIVRCKDCKHYYDEQGSCELHDECGPDGEIEYRFYVTPDWFCADGEIEND